MLEITKNNQKIILLNLQQQVQENKENIEKLKEITDKYSVIEKVELLPFKKLCLEKYETMGLDFPLKDTPQCSQDKISELNLILSKN